LVSGSREPPTVPRSAAILPELGDTPPIAADEPMKTLIAVAAGCAAVAAAAWVATTEDEEVPNVLAHGTTSELDATRGVSRASSARVASAPTFPTEASAQAEEPDELGRQVLEEPYLQAIASELGAVRTALLELPEMPLSAEARAALQGRRAVAPTLLGIHGEAMAIRQALEQARANSEVIRAATQEVQALDLQLNRVISSVAFSPVQVVLPAVETELHLPVQPTRR